MCQTLCQILCFCCVCCCGCCCPEEQQSQDPGQARQEPPRQGPVRAQQQQFERPEAVVSQYAADPQQPIGGFGANTGTTRACFWVICSGRKVGNTKK